MTSIVRETKRKKLEGQTYITVESIAAYCMVSRTTVRRWVLDGRLAAMKLPSGHFRVSMTDFRAFLERYNMPVAGELQRE